LGIGKRFIELLERLAIGFGANELIIITDLQNESAHQTYLITSFKSRNIGGAEFLKMLISETN